MPTAGLWTSEPPDRPPPRCRCLLRVLELEAETGQRLDHLVTDDARGRGRTRARQITGHGDGLDLSRSSTTMRSAPRFADARNTSERGDIALCEGLAERLGFEDREYRHRQPRPHPGHRLQQAEQISRLRVAKPYSVIESSRTIIAVNRRDSSPRRRVARVAGVALTRYPTPAASITAWSSPTSRTSPRTEAITVFLPFRPQFPSAVPRTAASAPPPPLPSRPSARASARANNGRSPARARRPHRPASAGCPVRECG